MGETLKRIISGVGIATFFGLSFNYNGFYNILLLIFVIIVIVLSFKEFYDLIEHKNLGRIYQKTGIFFGLWLMILFYVKSQKALFMADFPYLTKALKVFELDFTSLSALFFIMFLVIFFLRIKNDEIENTMFSSLATFFPMIYIALPVSFIFLIKGMSDGHGTFYIWLVSWITIFSDTMAYFSGKFLGRHKVGFAVSPNKTWEGYIGGLLGQTAITIGFYAIAKNYFDTPDLSYLQVGIFASVLYIIAVLGDLTESLFKRDAKIKDSGSFIPGHGGILDLLDAMFFTLPGFYYTYQFIKVL